MMETQLKAARRARGWSQMRLLSELQRVAKVRGVAVPARASLKTEVSRWENGHVTPTEPYVGLLAEAYQLSPAELGLTVAESFLGGPSGSRVEAPSRLSPESVALMDELIATYTKTDNVLGPRHVLHMASQHVVHLEPMLIRAQGSLRNEGLRLAARFAEMAGWLSQDAGDLAAAQYWTDRALDFLEESADAEQRAYVLMRKSAIAAEKLECGRSLSLATAACRSRENLTPRVRALVLRQRAISHALVRDEPESEQYAEEAMEVDTGEDKSDSYSYCTPAYVAMESGVSAYHLRKLDAAAERLSSAARAWPEGFGRDRGLCLARLAVVEVARGNIDVGCTVGHDALAVARVAESARTRAVLVSLKHRLRPYDQHASVSEFRRELTTLR